MRKNQTPRPVAKAQRAKEPVNPFEERLHTTFKAPPSSYALNIVASNMVVFEPT